MYKPTFCIGISFLLLCACHSEQQANRETFSKAITAYLDQRGDLCLAKSTWPIDVTEREAKIGSRNALQMPALEKVGLAVASAATTVRSDQPDAPTDTARRYQLTNFGKQFYLARAPHKHATDNRFAAADHDLCAARLTLDRVVGWELQDNATGAPQAVVTYTYLVKAAPWTADPDVLRVFPVVDGILRGAGTRQLKEQLVLGAHGWEAKDL